MKTGYATHLALATLFAWTLTPSVSAQDYCIPMPDVGTSYGDSIARFQLGTIDNSAPGGATAYHDYTLLSTDLLQGYPYTAIFTTGYIAPDLFAAWIDYNDNAVFEASEKLGENHSIIDPGETVLITFTVPQDAPLGPHRLRARVIYDSNDSTLGPGANMDPCTNYYFGETEDYTVVVQSTVGVHQQRAPVFTLAPNPGNGDFTITAQKSGDILLEVMDLSGRRVYAEQAAITAGSGHAVALSGKLTSGTYALRLTTDLGSTTRLVVVQ
ncbi:MAG: GEVED domain-containing protein [Flavobacteriales bacterium]